MPITSERETAGRAWTPGPWLPEHEDLSSKVRAPDGTMIAQVHQYRSGGIGSDERKANACLLAAAPDLYEVLAEIYIELVKQGINFGPLIADARAALSRVEVDHG